MIKGRGCRRGRGAHVRLQARSGTTCARDYFILLKSRSYFVERVLRWPTIQGVS